jgi:hypothetical protein
VEALADDVAAHGAFHALYVLPSAHVGFIGHMMGIVQDLQPKKIKLDISFARNHVCIERGSCRCAVSMRPLSHVFASSLGSIQGVHFRPLGSFLCRRAKQRRRVAGFLRAGSCPTSPAAWSAAG